MQNIYIGNEQVARTYHKGQVTHPSPVRNGLVLWYDFMGRKNTDAHRGVATDLSGNGNDGTLTNIAHQPGSEYEGGGLRFDGVDDYVSIPNVVQATTFSWGITLTVFEPKKQQFLLGADPSAFYIRVLNGELFGSVYTRIPVQKTLTVRYSITPGEKLAFVFQYDGKTLSGYVNGNLISQSTIDVDLYAAKIRGLGKWTNSTSLFSGILHSFMLYNRALTPTEIAHNYAMEKARWNL